MAMLWYDQLILWVSLIIFFWFIIVPMTICFVIAIIILTNKIASRGVANRTSFNAGIVREKYRDGDVVRGALRYESATG